MNSKHTSKAGKKCPSLSLHLFAAHLFVGLLSLSAQSPASNQRLTALRTAYETAYQKEVATVHTAALADLDAKYTAALDRALTAATQAGQLDTAVALRDEKKRVADKAALPADDFAAPETLKTLRLTCRSALASLELKREQLSLPVKAKYDADLETLQTSLTKAGDLDAALAVRSIREALKTEKAPETKAETKMAQEAPAPSTTPTNSSSKAKANDPEAARKLIEFVFSTGPALVMIQTKDQEAPIAIKQLAELPEKNWTLHTLASGGTNPQAPELYPWELLPKVPSLVYLGVNQKQPLRPEHLAHLHALPLLNRLDFGNVPFTNEALQAIPVIKGMTHVRLGPTTSDPAEALQIIGEKFPDLPILNISFPVPVEHLPGSKHPLFSLKEFSIKGTLNPEIIAKLAAMPQLKAFECKDCREPSLPPDLLLTLKHCRYLKLTRCKPLADLTASLAQFDSLDLLYISISSADSLTSEALAPLAKLKSRRLELDGGAAKKLSDDHIDAIVKIQDVKEMRFALHQFTPEGISRIKKGLPRTKLTGL